MEERGGRTEVKANEKWEMKVEDDKRGAEVKENNGEGMEEEENREKRTDVIRVEW